MNPYDPMEGFVGPVPSQGGEDFFVMEPSPFEEFRRDMMRLIADCFPGMRTVASEGPSE